MRTMMITSLIGFQNQNFYAEGILPDANTMGG